MNYKAGDLLPNGEIYLCRLDDEFFTVADIAPKGMNWNDAMHYAKKLGLELPDLEISQIMFKKKDEGVFKGSYANTNFLWTSRRYSESYAYFQWLDDGLQTSLSRVRELSVRPVRRLTIKAFNNLVGEREI